MLKLILTSLLLISATSTLANTESEQVKDQFIKKHGPFLKSSIYEKEVNIQNSNIKDLESLLSSMNTNSISNKKIIIKSQGLQKSLEDLKNEARGGDVVGNGGDELRKLLIQSGHQIIQEIQNFNGDNYTFLDNSQIILSNLAKALDEKNIIFVENISYKNTTIEENLTFVANNKNIIIQRDFLDKAIKEKKDTRLFIIHLLLSASQVSEKELNKSLELYSTLSTQRENYSSPFCFANELKYKLIKTAHMRTFTEKTPLAQLKDKAINACTSKGLYSCEIVKSYTKGLFGIIKNVVTYKGYTKEIKRSPKGNSCEVAQICLNSYKVAPIGQVENKDLNPLEREVINKCN